MSLPTRVEALLTEEIVDVAVGDYHTVVMIGRGKDGTWSGELRAFGCNDDGQLGLPWLADEGDKQLPAVVEWPPERAPEDQVAPAEVQAEAEQKAEDIYESDEDKPDEDAYVLAARLGGGSALVAKQAAKEAKEMSAAERMLAKAMEVEAAEEERIANEKARIAEKALKEKKNQSLRRLRSLKSSCLLRHQRGGTLYPRTESAGIDTVSCSATILHCTTRNSYSPIAEPQTQSRLSS